MATSGTTSEKEWQQVTSDTERQQMTMSDSEWKQAVQPMKTAQHTSKNGWLPFFLWQKQIHCFRGWMLAIKVVK